MLSRKLMAFISATSDTSASSAFRNVGIPKSGMWPEANSSAAAVACPSDFTRGSMPKRSSHMPMPSARMAPARMNGASWEISAAGRVLSDAPQAISAQMKTTAPPSNAVAVVCSLRASGWSRYPVIQATRVPTGVRSNDSRSPSPKAVASAMVDGLRPLGRSGRL